MPDDALCVHVGKLNNYILFIILVCFVHNPLHNRSSPFAFDLQTRTLVEKGAFWNLLMKLQRVKSRQCVETYLTIATEVNVGSPTLS